MLETAVSRKMPVGRPVVASMSTPAGGCWWEGVGEWGGRGGGKKDYELWLVRGWSRMIISLSYFIIQMRRNVTGGAVNDQSTEK